MSQAYPIDIAREIDRRWQRRSNIAPAPRTENEKSRPMLSGLQHVDIDCAGGFRPSRQGSRPPPSVAVPLLRPRWD